MQGMRFAALSALIIFGGAATIAFAAPEGETARAVWWSAAVAFGTQVITYGVARRWVATNPMVGWGIGSLIRFSVVLVYAFAGVKVLGLSSGPALLTVVGFMFVTMLVEPLFLRS